MLITGSTRVFGLLGHPVRHSLSPAMHNELFRRARIDAIYVAFDVSPDRAGTVADAIRTLALSGVNLVEPERSKNFGMCCGAGGGRMWIEEKPEQRVNVLRVEQLLETQPKTIASSCPYCMTMLSDGVKAKEKEEVIANRDVLELAADALRA